MSHKPEHYRVLHPRSFDSESLRRDAFALDVLLGLSSEPKYLAAKYFYDAEGSRLFSRISELAEYYPTECEFEILRRHRQDLVYLIGDEPFSLVELGAGDGRKTKVILEALKEAKLRFDYVPIDISEDAIRELTDALILEFPGLACKGLVAEYFDAFRWLSRENAGLRKMVMILGSNIGNFDAPQIRVFLKTLWNALESGDLALIGFDLKKDIDVLMAAYNDSEGVTDKFNINVLARINRELGADFDLARFQHHGTYDVLSGAMESYLVSLVRQSVNVRALNKRFEFRPFEAIHTEYSYKFLPEDIDNLAEETGFEQVARYYDAKRYFSDVVWRVVKDVK